MAKGQQIDSKKITFTIQTGTTRELLVTWPFNYDDEKVDSYTWQWESYSKDAKKWIPGGDGSTKSPRKVATFTAPDNALKVRFKVRPDSKQTSADYYNRSGIVADSDTKEAYYFIGSWSGWATFSNWAATKNPPPVKVENISFSVSNASGGGKDLQASYDITKKEFGSILPYISGFEYHWQGWNGRDWTDLNGSFEGAKAGNEQVIANRAATGSISFNERARNLISGGTTVTFYQKVHIQAAYTLYRFLVTPVAINEYFVMPVETRKTKEVKIPTKQIKKSHIVFRTRNDGLGFYVFWYANSEAFFKDPATDINTIANFEIEWQYRKDYSIWSGYVPGDRWEIGAQGETVDVEARVEYKRKADKFKEIPYEDTKKTSDVSVNGDVESLLDGGSIEEVTNESIVNDLIVEEFGTNKIKVEKIEYYQWVYSFNLPDGVDPTTEVRVRIKPIATETDTFEGEWSSWKKFKRSIDTIGSSDALYLYPYPTNARRFDAMWTKFDVQNCSGFSYTWYYQLATDRNWRTGSSGTVDITQTTVGAIAYDTVRDTNAKIQNGGNLTPEQLAGDTDFYKWLVTYDAPAEAVAVIFELIAAPTYEGAFIATPVRQTAKIVIPVKNVDLDTLRIQVEDAANRTLIASWTPVEGDDVKSYECVWEYYYLDMWINGQNGSTARGTIDKIDGVESVTPTSSYSAPTKATKVRFAVRPVASSEDVFKGAWGNYREISVKPESLELSNAYLTIQRDAKTARGLIAQFLNVASVPAEVENLIFEWSYYLNGIWRLNGSESPTPVSYPYSTYDIPENAEIVRVRVKADIDNINYIGEWSGYTTYNSIIPSRTIEDVTLRPFRGSDRSVIASWTADSYSDVDTFSCKWRYYLNGYLFTDKEEDVGIEDCLSLYQVPERSYLVEFQIKPNPKYEADFVGEWSEPFMLEVTDDTTPEVPSVPRLELKKNTYTFNVTVETYDRNTAFVEFEITEYSEDGNEFVVDTGRVDVSFNRAVYQFTGMAGKSYRARARGVNLDGLTMEDIGETGEDGWSERSTPVYSRPGTTHISVEATGARSIQVTVEEVTGADSYEVQYTTKKSYFDTAQNEVTSATIEVGTVLILPDLDPNEYYFRARAVNESSGNGDWSNIEFGTCGTIPKAPTTWSSRLNGEIDSDIYLYWTHNSEDGSREYSAEVEVIVNGVSTTITIPKAEDDTTQSSYKLPDSATANAGTIQWRVRTKGAMPNYGDWSTQRIIKIFSPPTVTVRLAGSNSWTWDDFEFAEDNIYTATGGRGSLTNNTLTAFPLLVYLEAGPASQTPVAYSVVVTSNSNYETSDEVGNTRQIIRGQRIFNRLLSTDKSSFMTMIGPGDIDLENGMSYTLTVTLAMDSGLSAERSVIFTTSWAQDEYNIDAEVGFDFARYIAYVRPTCTNDAGAIVPNVTLGVYRREFDGSFTLIANDISSADQTVVTDPHPNLDYARYRVTARSNSTGKVEFYDIPGFPVHEYGIILQWDESQISYNSLNRDEHDTFTRAGSMIRLPFNVDTTDSNQVDVEMVEYIGRSHPVSYFGTQVGQKATWTAVIPKTDTQTIYDLRRLARYMGNVYVREPSGTGYWAHVEVSFNLTHLETTVPVNLSITRVEGGM